jgi:hypothetical protein
MLVGGTELVSEEEPWVWALLVGFAFAAALAWAAYCRHTGGNAEITFVWYKGFTVKCTGHNGGGGW